MRNSEFVSLAIANAGKTKNVCCYLGPWVGATSKIPDQITTQFGKVVGLIQDKIDHGFICPDNRIYLIHNYEIFDQTSANIYCRLDAVIQNKTIYNNMLKFGLHHSLIINGTTSEVMNVSQGMLEIGAITNKEIQEEKLEAPVCYGKYHDYLATCAFAALANYDYIANPQDVFLGKYDLCNMVQHCKIFDSLHEARVYLASRPEPGKYIAEVIKPKEMLKAMLEDGFGKYVIKLFDYDEWTYAITPITSTLQTETCPADELKALEHVKNELHAENGILK